jgi:hypothetical protein|tara:strand:- start:1618 stop:1776 length:159 start_codon:yes stop_codon:yes gene_type:complete
MDEENKKVERTGERYASLSSERFHDEEYEDYKSRMRTTKRLLKQYMKGRKTL